MAVVGSKHNQLRELAVQRFLDAQTLFRNKRYNGAVYMAGYVVECALKAATCRGFREDRLRSVLAVHDLDVLVGRTPRRGGPRIGLWVLMQNDLGAVSAFEVVSEVWSSELRYETKPVDKAAALRVMGAVTVLSDWLNRQYV